MIAMLRLFRRLKWVTVLQWESLFLKDWPFESCIRCGKAFKLRWSVLDRLWRTTMEVNDDGGGSICIDCFIEIATKKGIKLSDDDFTLNIFQQD